MEWQTILARENDLKKERFEGLLRALDEDEPRFANFLLSFPAPAGPVSRLELLDGVRAAVPRVDQHELAAAADEDEAGHRVDCTRETSARPMETVSSLI